MGGMQDGARIIIRLAKAYAEAARVRSEDFGAMFIGDTVAFGSAFWGGFF